MGGFEVQEDLPEIGEKFTDIADTAAKAQGKLIGSIEGHDDTIDGFATTGRVDNLAGEWREAIDELCRRLAAVGGLLQENDANYRTIEETIEQEMEMTPYGN